MHCMYISFPYTPWRQGLRPIFLLGKQSAILVLSRLIHLGMPIWCYVRFSMLTCSENSDFADNLEFGTRLQLILPITKSLGRGRFDIHPTILSDITVNLWVIFCYVQSMCDWYNFEWLHCPIKVRPYTETEMSSFWWNFHHWLHRKLSKWQLSVPPVTKISSKWRHFRFSVTAWYGCRMEIEWH